MESAAAKMVAGLSDEQVADVKAGLRRKFAEEARFMAVPMGNAFAANLRVMGLYDEAEKVKAIVDTVLKWRAA